MVAFQREALDNFVGCVVMLAFTVVVVVLRFYVRLKLLQAPFASDWLCLLCLLIFGAYCGIIINHIFNVSEHRAFQGAGIVAGTAQIEPPEAKAFMRMGFMIEIIFTVDISLIKYSILMFYWNIFSIDRMQRKIILGTMAICTAWLIGFLAFVIFQCSPVDALWEKFGDPKHCISTPVVLMPMEISNLLIDVLILAIPVFSVRQLQLNSSRKWSVLGIFLLGAGVCVTSIVRLTAIWNPPDVVMGFDFSNTVLLSTLQLGMAIVCGCLPTLGPLFSSSSLVGSSVRSWLSAVRNRNGTSGYRMSDKNGGTGDRPWVDVGADRRGDNVAKGWAGNDNDSGASTHQLQELPPSQIRIFKEVEVK